MPKGYIVGRIDVLDEKKYLTYIPLATAAIQAHGGIVLSRGGRYEGLEGQARARNVLVEFPSFEAATTYYHSQQYERARAMRVGAAHVEIVVVEGV